MNILKKSAVFALVAVTFSGCAYAAKAKWKELVFTDDVSAGFSELTQYCMAHNVAASDVLWANNIDSADIKPGHSLYLPDNQADLLAIWQHKGAWQPKALSPSTNTPAPREAKKKSLLKEVPMPKIAGIPDLQTLSEKPKQASTPTPEAKPLAGKIADIPDLKTLAPKSEKPAEIPTPKSEGLSNLPAEKTQPAKSEQPAKTQTQIQTQPAEIQAPAMTAETKSQSEDTAPPVKIALSDDKTNDDIIAMLREEVKTNERNLPPDMPEQSELSPHVEPEAVEVAQAEPEPQIKPSPKAKTLKIPATPKKQNDSPAKVIAKAAKPDKILTSSRKKSAKAEIPGLMDPIIIFSPNGDPTQGPMRLVISGDKVEVVQLPKNAAPKRPSISDLDDSFGTNTNYLPHYNLTLKDPKKRDPFIFDMGNLAGKMMWPVDGKVSSPFGKWRGSHKHQGIDIPMPAGTPIRAAKNGIVARTGNNSTMGFRGYGNFVLMDHGDGLQTFYAHCLSIAVVQGQRVMQGQIVGYVGSTGRSTANHLHFEVRVNNNKVDPMRYLAGNTRIASTK